MRTIQYAGLPYYDRTPSTGVVDGPDLRVDYLKFTDAQELFRRQAQDAEFEAAEMSLSTFILLTSRGDQRFVGLPIFTSRSFRHRTLYINKNSGISAPGDLRGARIGVREYQMTAALWVRGMLADDYGLNPEDVQWFTGGLDKPGYRPRLAVDLPADVNLTVIPPEDTLFSLLEQGGLDALMTVTPPDTGSETNVRPLFSEPRQVEREYYRATGLFPIMHVVVLRRDRYEADPSLAADLARVFVAAKCAGRERMKRMDILAVAIPWLGDALAEVDEVFEGDAFPDGLALNKQNLQKALDYSFRQGLSERQVFVAELFAPEAVEVLG